MGLILFLAFIGILIYLAFTRASAFAVTVSLGTYVFILTFSGTIGFLSILLIWLLTAAVLVPLNFPDLRMTYVTKPLFAYAKKMLPTLSQTEAEALETGTVNWDGQLFGGIPDWNAFLKDAPSKLSKREQDFLDNEVEELCQMSDPWELDHKKFFISDKILKFICDKGFLGMIIPKKYGGLEFSARAQSDVVMKITSRNCSAIGQVVAVPNSLGPGELLLKYGTEKQKDHYLPRLAKGKDIPCFALTAPLAGSDAGAMSDTGIVEKRKVGGKEVIGIRLNFEKRYITLSPIATLVGLAFKLYDPDHLMGDKDEYGITCALIPADTKGLEIGRRHYPLHQAFPNGPVSGKDVFISLDDIIGGPEMAGKGWRMLMECLAVGRAISLPTGGIAASKTVLYTSTLYANIRRAFRITIGEFEGIQEKLAEMCGWTYISDSLRLYSMAAIDRGEKPAVPSAIGKYHATEMSRSVVNHGMDIQAGKAIMMGPKNFIARAYTAVPVAITVEGANILTRNMIIFGQGGTRCHPYLLHEMKALKEDNMDEFDGLLLNHIGFSASNALRSFFLGLSDGYFSRTPENMGSMLRYYQKLNRMTAAFAFVADLSMIILGGKLKFKESISARLGDALSNIYMASAALKRFEDDGRPQHMEPTVHYSLQYLLSQTQEALDGICRNFPNRFFGTLMRLVVFPTGRWYRKADDQLRHRVARSVLNSEDVRLSLSNGIYLKDEPTNLAAQLKKTVDQLEDVSEIEQSINRAMKDGTLKANSFEAAIPEAKKAKVINAAEEKKMTAAYKAMMDIIHVDDFDKKELAGADR